MLKLVVIEEVYGVENVEACSYCRVLWSGEC